MSLAIGVMADGQSGSVGSQAVGLGMSINPDPDHIWMPDTGFSSDVRLGLNTAKGIAPVLSPGAISGFVPMDSVPGAASYLSGQTPVETLCYALRHQYVSKFNYPPIVIGFSLGIGGFELAKLANGTQHYENIKVALADIRACALNAGYEFILPAVYWRHGEADARNENYKSQLISYRSDFNRDAKAILNQASDVRFIMAAPSSFVKGYDKAVLGMAALHRQHRDAFVLSHPSYMLYTDACDPIPGDYLHPSVRGQQLDGEYAQKTWFKLLIEGRRPDPLMAAGPGRLSGTTISIPMLVPVGPMVIDTAIITERPGTNKGLVFVDDSPAPPTITDVAVSGSDLVLTLSGSPRGRPGSWFVEIALHGFSSTGGRQRSEMPRCNIRDSDPAVAIFDPSVSLFNWAIPDRIPVV